MITNLSFFFFVRKYMFAFLLFLGFLYTISILFFKDIYVIVFVRVAQMMIGLGVLWKFRESIKFVAQDDYKTMPAERWPEHIATWGIAIFWSGVALNGAWLAFWQLVDIDAPPHLKLAISNSAINGFFVIMIVLGGLLKIASPPAIGGQLVATARNFMIGVVLSSFIIGSIGIWQSSYIRAFGDKVAGYLLKDMSIWPDQE